LEEGREEGIGGGLEPSLVQNQWHVQMPNILERFPFCITIAGMVKGVSAFGWAELIDEVADAGP
jgi:hypothetical protein